MLVTTVFVLKPLEGMQRNDIDKNINRWNKQMDIATKRQENHLTIKAVV